MKGLDRAAWLLCAVPLVGLLELGLHVKQTGVDVVTEEEWVKARDLVKADLKPDDLVLFEPYWTDPLGRRTFGDDIATMKREGFSDLQRFARIYEVSIRGAHEADLRAMKKLKEEKAGPITVTLYENPGFTPVIDDLVDLVTPERLTVSRVDGSAETPCTFSHGATAGGSTVVPQGLLTPGDKFVCNGGHVGVAVLHGLDHHPHLCIFATPIAGAGLRLRFKDILFGPSIVGHSGVQWVDERTATGEKITVTFSAFEHTIGPVFHHGGGGWTGFELPTPELDGKKGDLVAEIDPAKERQFCFEASTRRGSK